MLCNSLIYHQRAFASVHYNAELRIEAGCLKLDASETTIYSNDTKLQKRFLFRFSEGRRMVDSV